MNRKKSLRWKLRIKSVAVFTGLLLAFASPAASRPDDGEVLASLAENGVDKAVEEMLVTTTRLSGSAARYCAQQDAANLEETQKAWREAYLAWSWGAPFRIGPIKDMQLGKRIGLWRSNDIIFEGATTSPDLQSMLDKPELRGYAAAEYLLFQAKQPLAEQACTHLVSVTSEITGLTQEAAAAWNNYRAGFIAAGDGMPFLMESEAMSPAVAEILNATEVLLRDRIGLPSNFFEGKAKPETLEAFYSTTTAEGIEATFEGLKAALDGGVPNSLVELLATKDGLVNKKDPQLAKGIRKDIKKIEKLVSRLTASRVSLHDQLLKSPAVMKKLYKRLQKLEEKLIRLSLGLELDVKAGLEAQLLKQQ